MVVVVAEIGWSWKHRFRSVLHKNVTESHERDENSKREGVLKRRLRLGTLEKSHLKE